MAGPWTDFALIREHADFATILARYDIAPARLRGGVDLGALSLTPDAPGPRRHRVRRMRERDEAAPVLRG